MSNHPHRSIQMGDYDSSFDDSNIIDDENNDQTLDIQQLLLNFEENDPIFGNELLYPTPKESDIVHLNSDSVLVHGTIEAIITYITSPEILDYQFLVNFFLTFRNYIPALPVLELLLCRLSWCLKKSLSNNIEDSNVGRLSLIRTFVTIRHWLLNHFQDDFLNNLMLRKLFTSTINEFSINEKFIGNDLNNLQCKILKDLKKNYLNLSFLFWNFDGSEDEKHDNDLLNYRISSYTYLDNSRLSSHALTQLNDPSSRRSTLLYMFENPSATNLTNDIKSTNPLESYLNRKTRLNNSNNNNINNNNCSNRSNKLSKVEDNSILYPKDSLYALKNSKKMNSFADDNSSIDLLYTSLLDKNEPVQGFITLSKSISSINNNGFTISGNIEIFSDSSVNEISSIAKEIPVKNIAIKDEKNEVENINRPAFNNITNISSTSSNKAKKKSFLKSIFNNSDKENFDTSNHSNTSAIESIPMKSTDCKPVISNISQNNIILELEKQIKINDNNLDYLEDIVIRYYETMLQHPNFKQRYSKQLRSSNRKSILSMGLDPKNRSSSIFNPLDSPTKKNKKQHIDLENSININSNSNNNANIENKSFQTPQDTIDWSNSFNVDNTNDDVFVNMELNNMDIDVQNVSELDQTFNEEQSHNEQCEQQRTLRHINQNINQKQISQFQNENQDGNDDFDDELSFVPKQYSSVRSSHQSFGSTHHSFRSNTQSFHIINRSSYQSLNNINNYQQQSIVSRQHSFTMRNPTKRERRSLQNFRNASKSSITRKGKYNSDPNVLLNNSNALGFFNPLKTPNDYPYVESSDRSGISRRSLISLNNINGRSSIRSNKSYITYDSNFSSSTQDFNAITNENFNNQQISTLRKKDRFSNLRIGNIENLPEFNNNPSNFDANNFNDTNNTDSQNVGQNDCFSNDSNSNNFNDFEILHEFRELPFYENDNNSDVLTISSGISILPSPTPSQTGYNGLSQTDIKELASIPAEKLGGDPLNYTLSKLRGEGGNTFKVILGLNDHKQNDDEIHRKHAVAVVCQSPTKENIFNTLGDPDNQSSDDSNNEIKLEHNVRDLYISNNPNKNNGNSTRNSKLEMNMISSQSYHKHKDNGSILTSVSTGQLLKDDSERSVFDMQSLLTTPKHLDSSALTKSILSIEDTLNNELHIPFIFKYDSNRLAIQMTLIERDILLEVEWNELVNLKWDQPLIPYNSWLKLLLDLSNKSGLELITLRFNLVNNWIISEILLCKNFSVRVLAITRFIQLAEKCRQIQNYGTLFQILLALNSEVMKQLKSTWIRVDPVTILKFKELKDLTSPNNNFKNYRDEIKNVIPSKGFIPFLPLSLSDLTMYSEMPTFVKSSTEIANDLDSITEVETASSIVNYDLINFEKFKLTSEMVKKTLREIEWSKFYEFEIDNPLISKCLYISSLSEEDMDLCLKKIGD